jgi:hypothetical protein
VAIDRRRPRNRRTRAETSGLCLLRELNILVFVCLLSMDLGHYVLDLTILDTAAFGANM